MAAEPARTQELMQPWSCDNCRTKGQVRCLPSENVVSVYDRIAEAHAIASVDCAAFRPRTGMAYVADQSRLAL